MKKTYIIPEIKEYYIELSSSILAASSGLRTGQDITESEEVEGDAKQSLFYDWADYE